MAEGSIGENKYREVVVVPLAARREALALVLLISLIVLLMGLRFSLLKTVEVGNSLQAYQISDLHLQNQAPILYRSLLGSVEDILDFREENGRWPDIALLRNEELPPFASNFLPMGLRGFVWKDHASDGWVDYFGVNGDVAQESKQGKDPLENSFILRIIDLQSTDHPHPHFGQHNQQSKRFAYQVWLNPQITDYPAEAQIEKGWKWIVGAGTLSGGDADTVTSE
jgi:hypothetical protein